MVHDYPPLTGGGLALAALEVARLADAVADVTVLSSRFADHYANDGAEFSGKVTVDGCDVKVIPAWRAILLLRRTDVVMIHWTFSYRRLSTLAILLAPHLAAPVVCVIHTAPAHTRFNWVRRLPRGGRRLLCVITGRLLRKCDAVIALGPSHAATLTLSGIRPTHIAPIPARPDRLPALPPSAAPHGKLLTLGVAGELSGLKGTTAVPALLTALTPRFEFRITGEGPLRHHIDHVVRNLSPQQRSCVCVSDRLAPGEMAAFFSAIDCLIVPSWTESQCRLALEAMLAGVVVLARPVEGLADLVTDSVTGFHIYPEHVETVDRALGRLAEPAVRSGIQRRAWHRAVWYNSRACEQWRGLINVLVASAALGK
jgi:glycosyltransferase involved in cell wall biosynthesis